MYDVDIAQGSNKDEKERGLAVHVVLSWLQSRFGWLARLTIAKVDKVDLTCDLVATLSPIAV